MREENFRSLLDDYGIVRRGALEAPARTRAFTVFAQRGDARVEADLWRRHADQFFGARLELSVAKRYVFDPPENDAAEILIGAADMPEARRLCHGRPRTDDDLAAADAADVRAGSAGLGKLAARCHTVWLVETDGDPDRRALLVAAILASVVLGPILSPSGEELFGVRTARRKLEGEGAPYR